MSGGLLTEIGGRIGDFAARKVGRGSGTGEKSLDDVDMSRTYGGWDG